MIVYVQQFWVLGGSTNFLPWIVLKLAIKLQSWNSQTLFGYMRKKHKKNFGPKFWLLPEILGFLKTHFERLRGWKEGDNFWSDWATEMRFGPKHPQISPLQLLFWPQGQRSGSSFPKCIFKMKN